MNSIEIARKKLIQIAKSKRTISYSSLAGTCELNPHRGGGKPMADILDEISREEFEKNRNMLSAIVVRIDTGMPGDGFFNLARTLKPEVFRRFPSNRKFWEQERDAVHESWSN